MVKVVIIGGGIAGLSAATLLCDISNINIEIYEKENELGGQATSLYNNNNCSTEHCARVLGKSYHNIWYIFNNILNINNHFQNLQNDCLLTDDAVSKTTPKFSNLIPHILNTTKINNYYKYFDFFLLCKNRIINSYDNINALNYFDNNDIVKSIIGPYMGLEATKLSISSLFKNMYQIKDSTNYNFTPEISQITTTPTNDAIFNDWEKYIINKNVKIYKNSILQDVHIKNKKIKYIIINSKQIFADEFIFACSLKPLNAVLSNKYKCNTFENMKKLENNMQLYFAINVYFNRKINMKCDNFILIKETWKPVIQRKTHWPDEIIQKCKNNNTHVKEIWNISIIDFIKGNKYNKILRECTIEEATDEALCQIKNNKYIINVMKKNNTTFDDIYIGYDVWHQNKNSSETFPINNNSNITMSSMTDLKISDLNPKFSPNEGTMHLTPETHPPDIPENMSLAAYYCKNSYGGANMEASCETGLNASKYILDKYKIKNNSILPIEHTNSTLLKSPWLFVKLDELLYYNKMDPITKYINSFYLFIFIVLVCIILIIFFIYLMFINKNTIYKYFKKMVKTKNMK